MNEWQPINSAPPDMRDVLIWGAGQDVHKGYRLNREWWIEGGQVTASGITHWMPLPHPPLNQ